VPAAHPSATSPPPSIPHVGLLCGILVSILLLASACGGSVSPAEDVASLLESLDGAGFGTASQEEANVLESGFFPAPAAVLLVPGRRLLTFEFPDETEAATHAATVSSDGSGIANKYIGWSGTPHFFSRGRLIVIYQDDDEKMLDTLEKALGPQFAGG